MVELVDGISRGSSADDGEHAQVDGEYQYQEQTDDE